MCERTAYATRNEVPAPPETGHGRRPPRRLARVLARRLGQKPALLLGHGCEDQTRGRFPAVCGWLFLTESGKSGWAESSQNDPRRKGFASGPKPHWNISAVQNWYAF